VTMHPGQAPSGQPRAIDPVPRDEQAVDRAPLCELIALDLIRAEPYDGGVLLARPADPGRRRERAVVADPALLPAAEDDPDLVLELPWFDCGQYVLSPLLVLSVVLADAATVENAQGNYAVWCRELGFEDLTGDHENYLELGDDEDDDGDIGPALDRAAWAAREGLDDHIDDYAAVQEQTERLRDWLGERYSLYLWHSD
jgi:hypothetical protein